MNYSIHVIFFRKQNFGQLKRKTKNKKRPNGWKKKQKINKNVQNMWKQKKKPGNTAYI